MQNLTRPEPIAIAILAKAPIPGYAKTRLIPALGADGAAALQANFIRRTVMTARSAALGPVTLWCAPDVSHALFADMEALYGVALKPQPEGDLGARMLAAVTAQAGPILVIGTDCPVLSVENLHTASSLLMGNGNAPAVDCIMIPAEDGGYVAIGLRRPQACLFQKMPWSRPDLLIRTLKKADENGLSVNLMSTLWDVDEIKEYNRYINLKS